MIRNSVFFSPREMSNIPLLPAILSAAARRKVARQDLPPPPPTILLVDDDADLLNATGSTLEAHGFQVVSCTSPTVAEGVFARSGDVKLLLTDLQMPEFSGVSLAERLVSRDPSLPVLIVSGGSLDGAEQETVQDHGWRFLNKPVGAVQLLTVINGMLESTPAASMPGFRQRVPCPAETSLPPRGYRAMGASGPGTLPSARGGGKGKVLLVGDEPMVQRSRCLVLERAGYTVEEITSFAVGERADFTDVQLVLLCRSLSAAEAEAIGASLHSHSPHLPILRLALIYGAESPQFAATMKGVSSPGLLLAEVDRLISQLQ